MSVELGLEHSEPLIMSERESTIKATGSEIKKKSSMTQITSMNEGRVLNFEVKQTFFADTIQPDVFRQPSDIYVTLLSNPPKGENIR